MPAPTLTAVTPATVDARGGTVVRLTGTNFEAPLAVEVLQTGDTVAIFDIRYDLSPTTAFVGLPVLPPGTYDLRVTTGAGSSSTIEIEAKRFAEEHKVEAARLKWAPVWKVGDRWLSTVLQHSIAVKGLLQAAVEAIHGGDEALGGQRVTRLTAPLSADETTTMEVEATPGFGEDVDGAGDARLLVNGEIILAAGRTDSTFTTLTRGVDATPTQLHAAGSIVYDLSRNVSAVDMVRRGLLVNYATGIDLDVIGSNLGLTKCPTIGEEQWRRFIRNVAYLPKTTLDAFAQAMLALTNDASLFSVSENPISRPYQVDVDATIALGAGLRGRFFLNGGEQAVSLGSFVQTQHPIANVIGVYPATTSAIRGYREGLTNFFAGGSFTPGSTTITLGTNTTPLAPVVIDYGAQAAHYLAQDETVVDDGDDVFAYLSDLGTLERCVLNQVRAAGVRVEVRARL